MKCTPSGHKWAHVSCVLWIPEVSIGCAEKMEPITKISSIPASRWSLVCVLCRERKGACIQCSVKTCKTAYHVTCAFKHGLEMRAIIEDESADDGVKLRSYCHKHSVNSKKGKANNGSGEEEEEVKRKRRKDMTSEEKSQARAARLQEIEREFDRHVSVKDISSHLLDVDQDAINYIYNYWKLKRRAGHNRPLLPPKSDDNELLTHRQEQADLDKMRMFVQLRQDLERVRNLCYMVSRREKLSRSYFRMREQTFHKQLAALEEDKNMSATDLHAISEANHGTSIYDRLYSHPNAADHKDNFENILATIAPPRSDDDEDEDDEEDDDDDDDEDGKKKDRNGIVKGSKSSNPYKKHYVNGSRRSGSMYSGFSSDDSAPEVTRSKRYRGRAIGSSTDDEVPRKKPGPSPKKKVSPKGKGKRSPKKTDRKKKKVPQSKALVESSSEEEALSTRMKKDRSRSKTLQQMEKEMAAGKTGQSASDSDELITMRSTRNNKFPVDIYSDSSDDGTPKLNIKPEKSKTDKIKSEKTKPEKAQKLPIENDSQQQSLRTKGAMKEFIPEQPEKKTIKEEEKSAPKKRGRKPSNKGKTTPSKSNNESDDEAKNKENIKYSKQKDNPTDLIVPQRQAAKKASENMRSTTIVKKDEPVAEKQLSGDDTKSKSKVKSKGKEVVPAKVGRKKSSKDQDKETIAYVPQRQAAKKAAAHIKSGLGSKFPVVEVSDTEKKKETEKPDLPKSPPPKKDDSKVAKPVQKESSSTSSNSSSSSYSSSSSSEEEPEHEKPEIKPSAKAREIKPATRPPSMFSPPGTRPTVDLPFLDKVSRPLSSTSASSDSDSSKESKYSGSSSPCPKRPRRRRKGKSLSTDTSPRKAPDKKLKTSEQRPECGVSSPPAEGEESSRPNDARTTTRARTRSTASSGNISNKLDARQRKPSKDDAGPASGSNKTPKEGSQSSKLPSPERKANEAIKKEVKKSPAVEPVKSDFKAKPTKNKRLSESMDDKDKVTKPAETDGSIHRSSPKKSVEPKHKSIASRRMSVKELKDLPQKEILSPPQPPRVPTAKESKLSRHETSTASSDRRSSLSPVKKSSIDKKPIDTAHNKSPPQHNDFPEADKHWISKALSPNVHPPPIEKPGGHEKYMTDDKTMDSEFTEKSSINMIAKIQATLNENTMIRSPKTPMDARTMDPIDVDNPMVRNIRKRSVIDSEKKFITQDASHLQGVEISKSAKIPSTVNPYPNRSIFSPQPKVNELFEFDMLGVDDGFNHEDVMKPFTNYPEFFFKEDSKEQGVQETLNLVDRLRMQLSTKKVTVENSAQDEGAVNADKEYRDEDNDVASNSVLSDRLTPPPNQNVALDLHDKRSPVKEAHREVNHRPRSVASTDESARDTSHENKDDRPVGTSGDKWPDLPVPHSETEIHNDRRNYDHSLPYNEEIKEPVTVQSDALSVSEVGDAISLSKQSDDSQPLSVVDHSVHSNDQELTQDNQNYENNNSVIHSDCATISSPYASQDLKWQESKIATRRSSASSTSSEESICSQKTDVKSHMNSCDSQQDNVMPEIDSYPPLPAYSCPVEPAMPLNQYSNYAPDASPFLTSMGSLPLFGTGACASSQLTLPSPGPGLYASGLPFTPTPLIQPLTKPTFPLCAAFTTSSQNIALTTAMIAPPTPKPMDSPRDDIDVTGSDKFSIHVVSSPSVSVESYNDARESSSRAPTKMSNDSNETVMTSTHSQDSQPKTSPKPLKPMPKFPGKSPGKSPAGISPKQSEAPKGTKRPSNRSNRSQRGRGRSKSRAQGAHGFPPVDYTGNSIQSKLVGTVYDFDEEIANDGVDLKALRERRKSVDVRDDRKSEHSYKDTSQSPRAVSSPQNEKKSPPNDSKEDKSSSPGPKEKSVSPSKGGPGYSQVPPVLPGPVDMRTYQPFEKPAPAVGSAYHSHLLAFASGTAEQQLAEIDEEVEKQLHSALMASNPAPGSSPSATAPDVKELVKEMIAPQLPKVSLSDSRNQLKVKIKGPFLDANYSTSSVQPAPPQPPAPVHTHEPAPGIMGASSGAASSMTGSTNLRRMRKKELLRQYWTQDMNMDDPTHASTMGVAPPPAAPPPLARAVITIPKAVASMTSIPTREDYKITDTPIEKKKRKTTSGLSRELRHLEVSMNDDVDPSEDPKMPSYQGNSSQTHKRRGRASTKPNKSMTPMTPKLKIKIGSNVVQQVREEPLEFQFRPPKKRIIAPAPKPSLEDLRRESMKYRKMVMADFAEHEKTKKSKPTKSEKRKKKKDKKAEKLQVVNSESDSSAPKLIIKIKRPKEDAGSSSSSVALRAPGNAAALAPEPPVDPFEYDPSAPDPLAIDPPSYSEATSAMRKIRTAKVTPIRLKLARSAQGSAYVMKEPGEEAAASSAAPSPSPQADALPVSVNKHCEVR